METLFLITYNKKLIFVTYDGLFDYTFCNHEILGKITNLI